jgi:hypothetical protein
VRWERLFEDLQDQFASEWEAERAALDTEAERLRLARLPLRARLISLTQRPAASAVIELAGGATVRGTLTAVGEDWIGIDLETVGAGIVRADAVLGLRLDHADLLRSAREIPAAPRSLAERMTLGFVLRDFARRRVEVSVHGVDGSVRNGTVDRAGADHLDLALHEPGASRRAADVSGFRLVPFTAVAWLRVHDRTGSA